MGRNKGGMSILLHPMRRWRQEQEPPVSVRRLAEMLEEAEGRAVISYASLIRIENGEQQASADLMRAMHRLSNGAVRPDDFVLAAGQ